MSEHQETAIVFRKGERVVLRPILRDDVPLLLRWINDPEVSQYLPAYFPMMEADEEEWVENLHKRKDRDVVVMIVVDGVPIGTMGLHAINWKDRTAVTGAMIGEKEYWGKGYGTEAKMLLLDYAFNTLNLRKICSVVLESNERSLRYNLKCGYKEEGRRRAQHFEHGKYWDEVLLAVFGDDWRALQEDLLEPTG